MNSVHETFFHNVKNGEYEHVLSCNEIVAFSVKPQDGKRYRVSPMLCDAFCILFVKSGTAKLSVNYTMEVLQSDTMIFLTPNMILSFTDSTSDFSMDGICFLPAYFDDLSSYVAVYNQMISFLNENTMPVLKLASGVMDSLNAMFRIYSDIKGAQIHNNGMLLHLSNLILLRISEVLSTGCMSDSVKVSHSVEIYRAFRKLLITYYPKEHYIFFYASRLNVSSTYLSRVVRKVSGRSVNEHIAHMLVTEARRLLDCTDEPVKQIAYRLGFADQASFGKFFKNQFGVSPTSYRSTDK